MGLNNSANVFSAGDNGGRLGQLETEISASQLANVSSRLGAEHVAVLGMLPNARLTRFYGTAAPKNENASDALCPECEYGWRALLTGKSVTEVVDGRPLLAVPMHDPAVAGFPGVLLVSREVNGAAFTNKDLEAAQDQVEQLNHRLVARRNPDNSACGIILLDAKLRSLMTTAGCALDNLDAKVRSGLLEDAKSRFSKRPRRAATRIRIRDSKGAYQNFRVELRRNLPIEGGVALAYTIPPKIADWSQLDESTFAAAPELQRLIPALKFMISKFATLPGLPQIAAKAKLSPFHFHREFSALLGISPKHLMLDCQIEYACQQLLKGDIELIQIARSCGFAHQSHFTSRFKQATGLTPTAWRKVMRPPGE